jgi:hypothetical protein
MSIDEVYKINTNTPEEAPTLKKALSSIAEQAVGTHFVEDVPTEVPVGKLVIYDDGSTRRVYIRTGKGSIGYLTLTMI